MIKAKSMNIVITTKFWPSIGGIETLAQTLAEAWVRMGHKVTIVTDVALGCEPEDFSFPIVRNPSFSKFLSIVKKCDVFVQNNISFKHLWPILRTRKSLVAVHHGFYHPFGQRQPWRERAKVGIARKFATNISVSNAVRESLCCGGHVIPNLYNSQIFKRDPSICKDRDLVFVGRLVSDKGAELLIDAVASLRDNQIKPTLTIIGDGPERVNIERQIKKFGLGDQIKLTGVIAHSEIPRILNRHRIMIVPSQWDEPFGIVALEGAACGCIVVGTSGGGLPEAIGPCGPTFTNGSLPELTSVLRELLENKTLQSQYLAATTEHLAKHQVSVIAERYIDVFHSTIFN